MIILFSRFVLTNQNQFIMENYDEPAGRVTQREKEEKQGCTEGLSVKALPDVKRIEDAKLKGAVCKTEQSAANIFGTYQDEQVCGTI